MMMGMVDTLLPNNHQEKQHAADDDEDSSVSMMMNHHQPNDSSTPTENQPRHVNTVTHHHSAGRLSSTVRSRLWCNCLFSICTTATALTLLPRITGISGVSLLSQYLRTNSNNNIMMMLSAKCLHPSLLFAKQ